MKPYNVFPDPLIPAAGPVSETFLGLGIQSFRKACRYVHRLPYGYNSNRDDPMSLFAEKMGSCTTKHAVIALLAAELDLPVEKGIGIYAMTEALVTGTGAILERFSLPCIPMVHCFLTWQEHRVDLTEGNRNGKNGPVDRFFHTEKVAPNISAKDEYLLYRRALNQIVLPRREFEGVTLAAVLKARQAGIALLRSKVGQ